MPIAIAQVQQELEVLKPAVEAARQLELDNHLSFAVVIGIDGHYTGTLRLEPAAMSWFAERGIAVEVCACPGQTG